MKNSTAALVVIFLLVAVRINGESNHGDPEDRKERDHLAKAQVAKERREKELGRQLATAWNAYRAARDTQDIIAAVDKLIAESKNRIAALEKAANLSVAMKTADRKRAATVAPNVKATANALKDLFKNLNKQVNPVAEAVSKSKATKEAYERLVKSLSWDDGVVAALDAEAVLVGERKKLEKLLISRATLVEFQTLMARNAAAAFSAATEIGNKLSGEMISSNPSSHRDGKDRTQRENQKPASRPKDREPPPREKTTNPEVRYN